MAWNVVIAGGGFGGFYTARTLSRVLEPHSAHVRLVTADNFMLYTPLLPGAAAGTLEPRHVVVPLREELDSSIDLRIARITGATPERNVIHIRSLEGHDEDLRYDQLVVALGSVSRTLPIPGLAEHGMGFKSLPEAIALRNHVIRTLEVAETLEDGDARREFLTYVFVGAGYAGLEGLAELQDFAADVMDLYPRCRVTGMRWVLVEASERVMPEIGAKLADFAMAELRGRGIEIRTSTTLDAVTAASATLSDGEVIPTRTARLDRRRQAATPSSRASGCRSTTAGGSSATATSRSRASRTSGRSATARRCPTRRARATVARRPRSTPSARAASWPTTSPRRSAAAGGGGSLHVQDEGRLRRHGAAQGRRDDGPDHAGAGCPPGCSPAAITWPRCPATAAARGCSSTGTSGCCSGATRPSSAASARR